MKRGGEAAPSLSTVVPLPPPRPRFCPSPGRRPAASSSREAPGAAAMRAPGRKMAAGESPAATPGGLQGGGGVPQNEK